MSARSLARWMSDGVGDDFDRSVWQVTLPCSRALCVVVRICHLVYVEQELIYPLAP